MPVDVDNVFNDKEDHIQYALGTMQAYNVDVEYLHYGQHLGSSGVVTTTGNTAGAFSAGSCYSGIIALNEAEALIKFLRQQPKDAEGHTLRVSLCE